MPAAPAGPAGGCAWLDCGPDGVGHRPAAGVLVVGRWGDLHAEFVEPGADRLDAPPQASAFAVACVRADEFRDQRCRRSISAAKKADAAFRMALARLSSVFSRRSCLSSADSSEVTPARSPSSTGLTHPLPDRLSGTDTKQLRHLPHRGPLRLVLLADLGDHPHRPLTQLRRVPPRPVPAHDSNPPKHRNLQTSRGGSLLTQ